MPEAVIPGPCTVRRDIDFSFFHFYDSLPVVLLMRVGDAALLLTLTARRRSCTKKEKRSNIRLRPADEKHKKEKLSLLYNSNITLLYYFINLMFFFYKTFNPDVYWFSFP